MKKYCWLPILIVLLFASQAFAKTAFVAATSLTGGGAGALDAIECEDILGDNSSRAIATGDVCLVMTGTKDFYVYVYDATGSDSEASPDIILPDDRADCAGAGQWNLTDSVNVARTAAPQLTFRDSDCTDMDDNAYIAVNCSDTGTGTEDCDIEVWAQIAGVATKVFSIDADGYYEVAQDVNLATGKVIRINGTQISLDAVTDSTSYQRVAAADVDASSHVNRFYDSDGTGYITMTGPTVARVKTVADTADTILELAGSYSPTGYWNFSTASYVRVPYGANPTTDVAGKIALDSSTGAGSGIRIYTDGAYTIPTYQVTPPIVIKDPTADSDYSIWRAPYNVTIRAVHYLCTGGTNWVGQLQEADANGGSGADTQAADSTAAVGTTTNVTSFSNATVDSGDWVNIKSTSISGTPTSISICFEYTVDQVN